MTYNIVKKDSLWHIEGLENWQGDPDTVLIAFDENDEPNSRLESDDDKLAALYGQRQVNSNIQDGDIFLLNGKPFAMVNGIHVTPVIEAQRTVNTKKLIEELTQENHALILWDSTGDMGSSTAVGTFYSETYEKTLTDDEIVDKRIEHYDMDEELDAQDPP